MFQFFHSQYAMFSEQLEAIKTALAPVRLSRSDMVVLLLRKLYHDLSFTLSDLVKIWQDLPSITRSTTCAALILTTITIVVGNTIAKRTSLTRLGLPLVKPPKGIHQWDYKSILDEGSSRFPNQPYVITYSGFEYVVFPESSWDEIKRVPVSKASTLEFFTHVFFGGWRFLGSDISAIHTSIRTDLTRALPARVWARQDSARSACKASLGHCPDWTSFRMYWVLQSIVARTNASGLVGPELGNDGRWAKAAQSFPMCILIGITLSSMAPRLLRPVVGLFAFIPAWIVYWYMRFLLRPMTRQEFITFENATGRENKDRLLAATPEKMFPISAWLLSRYNEEERSPGQIAHDFIVATFESTPSTAGTFYFIMAELVMRPELVEELRKEISSVLVNGRLPQTQLGELQKLDSVMRECSRYSPFGHMALFRRLQQPVRLSIGPELPAGTLICVDVHGIPRSSRLWRDPDTFDPMRFLKLRQQDGHESRHQFVSLGSDTPGWGDGPQACPGRAFADNTLKITLVHLLMNYDFRLPPGGSTPKRGSMPNGSMRPDMSVRIQFKERRYYQANHE